METTVKALKYYNGLDWAKVYQASPYITSISGGIYTSEASTLTLTGGSFLLGEAS